MSRPADVLPSGLATACRVDRICDRFEAAWLAGRRPRIEDELAEVEPPLRPALLRELLAVEVDARRRLGEPVAPGDYRARFTDDPDAVRGACTTPSDVDPGSGLAGRSWDPSTPGGDAPDRGGVTVPPGFELIGPLGRGGMGVVWKARQVALNRVVALKMIGEPGPGGLRNLARFLVEAEAMAAVRHPHVVPVFESGAPDGRPFLAMEYLPGGSLADRLRLGGRLVPLDAARLVATLAGAVQAAHDLGIVHRDLKPGNVLYDEAGTAKVADFGLAKWGGRVDLTTSRDVLGTPAYMAPEQARGGTRFVGPAADIYALGCILYECLTATRPFPEEDPLDLLRAVVESDPEPPGRRARGVPRDVELICLRCLAKAPADRYPTAAALADDLGRFAAGLPVSVRPAGVVEGALRWARRQPTLAAAYALTAAVAVLLAFGASLAVLYRDAVRARAAERQSRVAAEANLADARRARGEAETNLEDARRARGEAEAAREALARVEYGRAVQLAYQEWRDGRVLVGEALLGATRPDLRAWEHDFVWGLGRTELTRIKAHTHILTAVAYSPDGARIASSSRDRTARIWRADDGAPVVILRGHTRVVAALAWSPDGARLATSSDDSTARTWDSATWDELAVFRGHSRSVTSVGWSPDGRRIVTGCHDNTTRTWAAAGRPESLALAGHKAVVRDAAWGPDGRRLATVGDDGVARIWAADSGAEALSCRGHDRAVRRVAWSPDGTRIVTAGDDGTARVWDARLGAERLRLAHPRGVMGVAWSPDGARIATASRDGSLRTWDAATGAPTWAVAAHPGGAEAVAWSPDGRRLATASNDNTARTWDGESGRTLAVLQGHAGRLAGVAWGPDGRRLATASDDSTARIWMADSGAEVLTLKEYAG